MAKYRIQSEEEIPYEPSSVKYHWQCLLKHVPQTMLHDVTLQQGKFV